jgi:predicted ATPase/DNA-binding CsgD family transcriptional regulator
MATTARRPGNLPAESASFIGRRRELAEIRTRLARSRLVTLTGPGGVGKTRIAVRLGADLRRSFPDGAWLAELAEVADPAMVPSALLAALDLRDQAIAEPLPLVLSCLRDKELVLIVDNCEHLLQAAAQIVTEVLRTAPGVRVIATSREPMGAPGEQVIRVPPLELPSADGTVPLARLRLNETIALFTERAAAASSFELTTDNQGAVAEVCRRLDGMPLAIELAAVRTRVLSAEQIRDRLTDRFSLLTSRNAAALPRHQTLRTAIEWSHDLLCDDERALLRRCCVFRGRFTLGDVESVCAQAGTQPLEPLSALVDKSLVLKEEAPVLKNKQVSGVACYRLHETMREFAALKLAEAGETSAVEERLAGHYHAGCVTSGLDSRYRLPEWLSWADLEMDNIRAVLRWCQARGDAGRGLDITVSLAWYWITRATTEGIGWLETFLPGDLLAGEVPGDGGGLRTRSWGYFLRGFLAVLKGDHAAARPALESAVAAAQRARRHDVLCEALAMSSIAASMAGDLRLAKSMLAEAESARVAAAPAYQAADVAVLQARVLTGLAGAGPAETGPAGADLAAVRTAAAEGARLARAAGDLYALEMMLLNLTATALVAGDHDEAEPLLTEALRIADVIDDRVGKFYLVGAAGAVAARAGNPCLAARLLGAAHTMRTNVGSVMLPVLVSPLADAEAAALAALGPERFAAEHDAGRDLSSEHALSLALGEQAPPAAHGAGAASLGKRQTDVARLVAEGLTNRQIAARLFISERTVDSHVRTILTKLGFRTRAQIAAWVSTLDGLATN